MGELIYKAFPDFVTFRVRVKNWLNTSQARKSHLKCYIILPRIPSIKDIDFSSLRSSIAQLRNS